MTACQLLTTHQLAAAGAQEQCLAALVGGYQLLEQRPQRQRRHRRVCRVTQHLQQLPRQLP